MTPELIAERALDILRERGWRKGAFGLSGSPKCIAGAVFEATAEWAEQRATLDAIAVLLRCPRDEIAAWNDDPHTTFEDVALVLKKVAAGEGVE